MDDSYEDLYTFLDDRCRKVEPKPLPLHICPFCEIEMPTYDELFTCDECGYTANNSDMSVVKFHANLMHMKTSNGYSRKTQFSSLIRNITNDNNTVVPDEIVKACKGKTLLETRKYLKSIGKAKLYKHVPQIMIANDTNLQFSFTYVQQQDIMAMYNHYSPHIKSFRFLIIKIFDTLGIDKRITGLVYPIQSIKKWNYYNDIFLKHTSI